MSVETQKYYNKLKQYVAEYGEKLASNIKVAMDRHKLIFCILPFEEVWEVVFDNVDDAYTVLQVLRNTIQNIFDPFPLAKKEVNFEFIREILRMIRKGVDIYISG
ncbi:MAG: hypothetical protein QXS37_06760 [Candidatus Aenigmatarchaeota archaeon]